MEFHVGTSGYAYKAWKGKFYPEKIPQGDMLRFYAEHLGVVEINNTFYHMPTAGVLTAWTEQVPVHFLFAFKAPRIITHQKHLKNVGSEVQYLFRTLSILHGKLGPVLFQFPASFHVTPDVLGEFLTLIPRESPCAFEFRSPVPPAAEVLNLLTRNECSLCMTDRDEHPATNIISTAPWGYLRLRRNDYTDADLSSWLHKIHLQKWKKVFVFFKHEEGAKGPELAVRFRRLAGNEDLTVKN